MTGHDNPCTHELVRMTLKGIKRIHDMTQGQASPLLRDDLISILNGLTDTPKHIRDKALLMIGFAGALRRSELVALNIASAKDLSGR
jgi:site-specific recombinase XerC